MKKKAETIDNMTDAELLAYPYLDNLYPIELDRLRAYADQCGIKTLDELDTERLTILVEVAVNGETSINTLRIFRNS